MRFFPHPALIALLGALLGCSASTSGDTHVDGGGSDSGGSDGAGSDAGGGTDAGADDGGGVDGGGADTGAVDGGPGTDGGPACSDSTMGSCLTGLTCIPCPSGQYGNTTGLFSCAACPVGSVQASSSSS